MSRLARRLAWVVVVERRGAVVRCTVRGPLLRRGLSERVAALLAGDHVELVAELVRHAPAVDLVDELRRMGTIEKHPACVRVWRRDAVDA